MEEFRLTLPVRGQLAVRVQQAVSLIDKGVLSGGTRRHSFRLLAEHGTPIQPVAELEWRLPRLYRQSSDLLYSRLMHQLAGGGPRVLLVVTDRQQMQILGSPNAAAFDIILKRSSSKLDQVLADFHPAHCWPAEAAA